MTWHPVPFAEALRRWEACGYAVSFCTLPHTSLIRCGLERMERFTVGDGETPLDALAAATENELTSLPPELRTLWLEG